MLEWGKILDFIQPIYEWENQEPELVKWLKVAELISEDQYC